MRHTSHRLLHPAGWPLVVPLLFALSACVQGPRAAVADAPDDVPAVAVVSAVSPERRAPSSACEASGPAAAPLAAVQQQLRPAGLALRARCDPAAAGWVMEVLVLDGVRARKVVRGPLADGQPVDMGTPAGASAGVDARSSDGFSPDVQFNRQWLRTLLAGHGFDPQPDAWWHFAWQGPQATPAETDLAAR